MLSLELKMPKKNLENLKNIIKSKKNLYWSFSDFKNIFLLRSRFFRGRAFIYPHDMPVFSINSLQIFHQLFHNFLLIIIQTLIIKNLQPLSWERIWSELFNKLFHFLQFINLSPLFGKRKIRYKSCHLFIFSL